MPTNGILNATLIICRIGNEAVAACTQTSVQFTAQEVDTTNKDSAGWKSRRPGLISATASIQGYLRFDTLSTEQGISDLFGYVNNRTKVALKVGTTVQGDKTVDGDAYITSLNVGAPVEDSVTFEASFKFTGPITLATNA